ncbi:MAG: hypothetical protein EOO77_06765 [Oxalobacteraceae bacterium]|nr:MAG: hypothetical protein EOO77_06765 [Oxalobacteraceae bacterium]
MIKNLDRLLRLQRLYIWRLLEGSNQSVMLYADTFELGPVAKAATFETPKTQEICIASISAEQGSPARARSNQNGLLTT